MLDVAIVGGGLSGLALAQQLQRANRDYAVFESRERFGGRILSVPASPSSSEVGFDLGPSWVWPESQPRLSRLIFESGIKLHPQWFSGLSLYQTARTVPAQTYVDETTYASAYRIAGGAQQLVKTLLQHLPQQRLKLQRHLHEVIDRSDYVELQFEHGGVRQTVLALQVVIAIPPRLLVHSLSFTPALDSSVCEAMNDTITWMASHAKALIRYRRPFWREAGLSGAAYATYQGAALVEIFDASSPTGEEAALSGFFALPALLRSHYRNDLEALILEQLVRLFGKEAATPEEIQIKDWFADPLTATPQDEVPPNAHPRYGHPALQQGYWNNKLHFSGTETAPQFGGYLEGALESAERVAKSLLNNFNRKEGDDVQAGDSNRSYCR